jgi:hypothetical protein
LTQPQRNYPDNDVVAPISLPPDGRVPDPASGMSTSQEYDTYFRIDRSGTDLVNWSRTCLEVQDRVMRDLGNTDLSAEDRFDIARGLLAISRLTMTRWMLWEQAQQSTFAKE